MACGDCNGNCGKCGGGCPPPPVNGCNTCNESKGFAIGGTPAYFFGVDIDGNCRRFTPLASAFDLIQHGDGPPGVGTETSKPFYFDDTDLAWYTYVNGAWRSTTDIDIVVTGDAVAPSGSGNPTATKNTFRVLSNGDTYFIDSNGVSMAIFTCVKLKAMLESECIPVMAPEDTISKIFVITGAGNVKKATVDQFTPKIISFNLLLNSSYNGQTELTIAGWNQTVVSDMFIVIRNGVSATIDTATIDTSPAKLYEWKSTGLKLFQAIDSSVNAEDKGETFQIICFKRPLP